jgi:hypothetical protein
MDNIELTDEEISKGGSGWAKDIFLANVCNGCEEQDMGILDNFEAYIDIDPEKCHYCTNKAKYTDVAEIAKQGYAVIGVCQCHYVQDVS